MSYLADLERKYIAALATIKELAAEAEQLRAALVEARAVPRVPIALGLTTSESSILEAIMARGGTAKSKDAILSMAYSTGADDEPDVKIVDVFVCKLRKKLTPHGVTIETVVGRGYRLPAESMARLARMNEEAAMDQVQPQLKSGRR